MKRFIQVAAVAAIAVAGAATAAEHSAHRSHAGPPPQASDSGSSGGPVAVYWMSAQTSSGFMAGMTGGGGKPSMGSMMGMMMRGGPDPNAVNHTLRLQLGSNRRPDGRPQAEHDPDPGLNTGALPLVTPVQQPSQPVEEAPQAPQEYHRPHGRMLIYWGCGEHAPPGQPYVIDFARLGNDPTAFAGLMRGMAVTPMQPPSPSRFATYGEWPNAQSRATIPANSSLIGPHTIRGDYSPDIHFNLGPGQDFMAPLQLVSNNRTPSGAVLLGWRPVPTALGYFATAIGGAGEDQIVMWTSSASQTVAFALTDYLSPGETRRLVQSRHLMAPAQTQCAVPQEVVRDMGRGGFVSLNAYGDEANFAWPERPQRPQWFAKVRYRSTTSALLGQPNPMGGGGRGRGRGGDDDDGQQQQRPSGGGFLHGLGGFIP
jgi:hypothetical protein